MSANLEDEIERQILYLLDLTVEIITVNKQRIEQMTELVKTVFQNGDSIDSAKLKRCFTNFLCLMDLISFYSDGEVYDYEQLIMCSPKFIVPQNVSFAHPKDNPSMVRLKCGVGVSSACSDGYGHFHRQLEHALKQLEVIVYLVRRTKSCYFS